MSAEARYRLAVIICSDRAYSGEREDRVADVIRGRVADSAFNLTEVRVVPDETSDIAEAIRRAAAEGVDVVLTSGGTGLGPRDVTPEATRMVIDRDVPGIAEAIRAHSLAITKRAMLSRGAAGLVGKTLVINLPGSPKAVSESLDACFAQLEHALSMIAGGDH